MNSLLGAVLLLLAPIAAFAFAMRKNWVEGVLVKGALWGICTGVCAAAFARLVYLPVEGCLGLAVRDFIAEYHEWFYTLSACIGIVGIIEETSKVIFGLLAYAFACSFYNPRPAALFMSFSSCALTFSAVENIQYLMLYGPEVIIQRILISSVAHLFFAALAAIVIKKAIIKASSAKAFNLSFFAIIGLGILASAVGHGLFDFMLFKFNFGVTDGILIYTAVLFLYFIKESYTEILKDDLPAEPILSGCTCGAITLVPSRFCCICGSRLVSPSPKKEHEEAEE